MACKDRGMPKTKTKADEKVATVMHEFKNGTLHSSSGEIVEERDQAIAIALSEAGKSRKAPKKKK